MFYEPFHIGPLRIAPYGIMVALGLLAAIVLGGRENQRIKLMTPELFEKVALYTVLWGLLTSRLFYVFTDLGRFMQKPSSIIAIWEGGLVFYGGPIGSALYLVYHFVIRRSSPVEDGKPVATYREGWQRLLRFFDLGAPMLALAHAFGRIGCLCAGCCYGAPHEGALALHYPEGSPAYVAGGMGRYPIPLMESGIELMLFFWLMHLRLNKKFNGQVMLNYVMVYPAARFVLEMFRGDAVRGYVARLDTPALNQALGLDPNVPVMLTTSQFISIIVVAAAVVLIFVGKRAAEGGPIPETKWWDDEAPEK
jgi:phosphatidylglycerol:prolipoprotein diacylglycerol transferase